MIEVSGVAVDESSPLRRIEVSIDGGDFRWLSPTDGLLDSENLRGERFGKERLRRAVHERMSLPAAGITAGVMDDFLTFTDQRQEDDITLFVMKLTKRSAT